MVEPEQDKHQESGAPRVSMDPLTIKFSQKNISRMFRRTRSENGPLATTVDEMLDRLLSGSMKVTDVPVISVVKHRDAWYSLDNRRLWVFRSYAQHVPGTLVPVQIMEGTQKLKEFFQKLDSSFHGEVVSFLDDESRAEFVENQTLSSDVLKWSIQNIQNDGLLANQVSPVPLTFRSVNKYLNAFPRLLLEEIRAGLKQSLERIGEAPRASVVALEEVGGTMGDSSIRRFRILLREDSPEGNIGQSRSKKKPSSFKPSDIVLLTTGKHGGSLDELLDRQHYTLSLLKSGGAVPDEVPNIYAFKAELFAHPESPEYEALTNSKRQWYVVYLNNLATGIRISKTLHRLQGSEGMGSQNHRMLREILDVNMALPAESPELQVLIGALKELSKRWFMLNGSQAEALARTVAGLAMKQPPSFRLIQGPPGTGKTSLLAAMLSVLSSSGRRVLLCAPTNAAICEVASRFLEVVRRGNEPFISGRRKIRSGDIVLVGNEDRLGADDRVEDIFLPERLKRLAIALSGPGGWHQKVLSMLDFVKDAVGMFDRREAEKDHEPPNFMQFARQRLQDLGEQMVSMIEIVCNDLPSCCLASTRILRARGILGEILQLMRQQVVADSVARGWFEDLHRHHERFRGRGVVPQKLRALLDLLRQNLHFVRLPAFKCSFEESDLLALAGVVCCTTSSAGKLIVQRESFDLAIIDEASQVVEAESITVFGTRGLQQVVLVGDHQQLPATVISKVAQDNAYGRSAFQRLQLLRHPSDMLDTQYRMHPSISLFPSRQFYGGSLKDGPNVTVEGYGLFSQSCLFGPYAFINVCDGVEVDDEDGHSRRNPVEARVVLHLLKKLVSGCRHKLEVGIISPYAGQAALISRHVEAMNLGSVQVEVKSVDGFSGREKDVILLSTVRTKGLGFLDDYRRLNVAVTRARHCICICGNERLLTGEDNIWKELISDAKRRNCFIEPGSSRELAKVIRKVKKELQQLEDLLRPDSLLFKNTIWEVQFSKEFMTSFMKIRVATGQIILNSILNLANGIRPKHNLELPVPASISGDIKIYVTSNSYLVWSVDVHQNDDHQVMKIWNIVDKQSLGHMLSRLQSLFATYTTEYLSCCREKRTERGIAYPCTWRVTGDLVRYKSIANTGSPQLNDDTTTGEEAKVSESLVLMKFYQLCPEVARTPLAASEASSVDFTLQLTKEESDAVEYPSTTFIVGRSGTGKTTVLTNKLLRREQLASACVSAICNGSPIRQVLLTVSPRLCGAIRHHIERIRRGSTFQSQESESLLLDDDAEKSLLSNIPDTLIDLSPANFPLIITFKKLLAMLDGSVEVPFFSTRAKGTAPLVEQPADADDELFSEDQRLGACQVDYSRFQAEYWPCMNSAHTRKLDPSLVFAEILSSIKGSPEALQSPNGRLPEALFKEIASRRASTFAEDQGESIYSLYVQYEKLKRQKRHYDVGDRVFHLHQQLQDGKFVGNKFDFIYVDEVQDLTLAQISLLRFLTDNVEHGFVFAGDTAQTIAKGVNFRFEDIRSLFYTHFLEADKEGIGKLKTYPALHQLRQNFRTHSGIIKLAGNVMKLMLRFFPETVDKLAPESSTIRGDKPVVVKTEENNLIATLFGVDQQGAAAPECDFGAEQVILVRDSHCKEGLLRQLGRCSLVLTVEECKGLEFQDVLLYNFFADSEQCSKWRVLYQFLEECNFPSAPYTKFDHKIHSFLCNELKQLYVAVTRAKQRLWIYDEHTEAQKPMLDCWSALELVDVSKLDDLVASMHTVSTPDEWKQRGREMFDAKQYDSAALCFQRAGDQYLAIWATAADLQQRGESMPVIPGTKAQREKLFREAAALYVQVEKPELAAKSLKAAGDYAKAGEMYLRSEKPEQAGDCFVMAKQFHGAAEAYASASYLQKCLLACQQNVFSCFR